MTQKIVSTFQVNFQALTLFFSTSNVSQAINGWKILILDHHDYLMPFLNRINTKGVCAYASRTLLFRRSDDTLKPIAIELSLPGSSYASENNMVLLPASHGNEAALWQLAKAHVVANDSVHHQLISHWWVEQFCLLSNPNFRKLMIYFLLLCLSIRIVCSAIHS